VAAVGERIGGRVLQDEDRYGSADEQTAYDAQGRHPARPGKMRSAWAVIALIAVLVAVIIASTWVM